MMYRFTYRERGIQRGIWFGGVSFVVVSWPRPYYQGILSQRGKILERAKQTGEDVMTHGSILRWLKEADDQRVRH
jgi:hypothetical protein